MPEFRSWFQCANPECGRSYPLNEVLYKCPRCDDGSKRAGLLEVRHDMGALSAVPAREWKELFDSRYLRTTWPYGSGVWGKKEWVCPMVADENIVSAYEGGSNLFWANRFGHELGLDDLWVKLCGNSHSGSFKDLGMTVLVSMVNQMIAEGKPIQAVACASTGDTSAALAMYGAAARIPVIVLLPESKVSIPQLIQPIANGAITLAVDTDFDGCMQLVSELCSSGEIYLANSMNSLRLEGQKTIAFEMIQQFDWQPIDWVIVPVGNCGNITAISKGFLMLKQLGLLDRLPRLVGAQAAHANPLADLYRRGYPDEPFVPMKARNTLANAIQIGDPVNLWKAIEVLKQMPDHSILDVTEDELADAAAWADRGGLFCCPQTGVALGALLQLVREGRIRRGERVVVISTANGLKFPSFKLWYHAGGEGEAPVDEARPAPANPRFRNTPFRCAPNLDSVRHAIDTGIQRLNAIQLG